MKTKNRSLFDDNGFPIFQFSSGIIKVRPNRGPIFFKGLNRAITRIAPRIRTVAVDFGFF
jgi:hypothetical protein